MRKFRKTLVAAIFPPGSPGGDWVIVRHLLRGADWNELAWWSFFPGDCHLSRTLGSRLSFFNPPQRLAPARKWRWLRGFLFERFVVPLAAQHLKRFIEREKPDQLWLLSYGWAIPVFHRLVPSLGIPWHFSMHDMPETAAMVNTLGPERAHRFLRMQDRLYSGAVSRNVVGSQMGAEMTKRTGISPEFEFRCSVEPEDLERLRIPRQIPDRSTLRIGYAGTIIAEDAFELLVRSLEKIQEDFPVPIQIHLFSSHKYSDRPWFNKSLIIEHGHLSFEELQKPYSECHWGLALMQLHDRDPQYNRFSFPCKFTQSLAAGLPLICIGHSQSTLIQLASQFKLGVTLTEASPERAGEALKNSLFDFDRFPEYRSESLRCAESQFRAEAMRRGFHAFLSSNS